jgi:cell division protein FtsI (penicillin-binding protein 3)
MLKAIHYGRIAAFTALLVLGFLLVEIRLFYLQILRHDDLGSRAGKYEGYRRISASWRGEIRARNGAPLAVSVPVKTVYADLTVCTNRPAELARIFSTVLGLPLAETTRQLRPAVNPATKEKTRLALRLQSEVAESTWRLLTNTLATAEFASDSTKPAKPMNRRERILVNKLREHAVLAEDDQMRGYSPIGLNLGHLLGLARPGAPGYGLTGVGGVERRFNAELAGAPGLFVSRRDAAGHELPFLRTDQAAARPGQHIELTLDTGLQEICDRIVDLACARHQPSNATVLVVIPQTGEILAWSTWPRFDPASPECSPPESYRNHALEDSLEPGSVFKLITLAAALHDGLVTLDQWMDATPGRDPYRGPAVRDRHVFGRVTVRDALAKSVNVVFSKIGIQLGSERFARHLADFGFGRPTGIPLPGESAGQVRARLPWPGETLARIPIGQGIGVTQLQMTMAVCALANQGQLLRPWLIRRIINQDGSVHYSGQPTPAGQAVNATAARQVLEAGTGVVSPKGTARGAMLDSHSVVGKTGTAQMSDGHKYVPDCYLASFIGLLPAQNPRVCISVVFNCPRNGHTGAAVAVPVFHEIAREAVEYLRIPPDKLVADRAKSI